MAKGFVAVLILVLFTSGAWAQTAPAGTSAGASVKSSSGVVTFTLDQASGARKPTVSVNLEGPMIRIAAAAAASGNMPSPISDLLDQIELVQVQVYEDLKADATSVLSTASKKIEELKQVGWTSVVSIPDKGEMVDVLSRTSEDSILGLVVLVAEKDELIFVNLAGEIDPEGLGQMIGKLKDGILDGDFDFEELLFASQGDDDDDDDDDSKEVFKEKMKDKGKDKDKEKEEEPKPAAESAPQQ